MKIYAALLLLLLIILQYKYWFEEGGYFYNRQLEKQLAAMKEENSRLKERNRELARKIILVKEDMNEIEALARQNLGMIKEGEKYMFIIDESKNDKSEKVKQAETVIEEKFNSGPIVRE